MSGFSFLGRASDTLPISCHDTDASQGIINVASIERHVNGAPGLYRDFPHPLLHWVFPTCVQQMMFRSQLTSIANLSKEAAFRQRADGAASPKLLSRLEQLRLLSKLEDLKILSLLQRNGELV